MTGLFRQTEINNLLINNQIKNVKTGTYEKYDTGKIILSLGTIGVPLDAAYSIAQSATNKVLLQVQNLKKEYGKKVEFNSKQIRNIVTDTIQLYSDDDYHAQLVEEWSEKYVRRYGNDNQIVQIYDDKDCNSAGFKFFNEKLIPDIIQSIVPNVDITMYSHKELSRISNKIIDFIDGCALYRINYDLLKQMIIEIALQPPHPWFVNDDTRERIFKYDYAKYKDNSDKLKKLLSVKEKIGYSLLAEVLHHSSALLLAKYQHYMGVNDISCFYILRDYIRSLMDNKTYDLIKEKYSLQTFSEDLVYAGVRLQDLYNLINDIANGIARHDRSIDMINNVIKYSDIICQIATSNTKDEIGNCLNASWIDLPKDYILNNLSCLLQATIPSKKVIFGDGHNFFIIPSTQKILTEYPKEFITVYYAQNENIDADILLYLSKKSTFNKCDKVLIVSENEQVAKNVRCCINNNLNLTVNYDCGIFVLCKSSLIDIYNSQKKQDVLSNILEHQVREAIKESMDM